MLDDDGFLHITDRKKDILVTAGGKSVAPQNIETTSRRPSTSHRRSWWATRAICLGTRHLDPVEVERWASENGIDAHDASALARDERVHELLQGVVDDVNRDRSRFEQVKRFAILPRDFTLEDGEIADSKVRRRAVQEHFAAEIDALYAEPHLVTRSDPERL